uniref:G-protein coupled receptors family 1 profile domain-containing protein n=1 Tax=Latimeria chalumnae TaxID=7897 RepID=H2ZXA8_LATCH
QESSEMVSCSGGERWMHQQYNITYPWLQYSYVLTTIACILLLFGVTVNGLVIWILSFRTKRNLCATYLLNLSISDCLFLVYFTATLITLAEGSTLPLADAACKILSFLFYLIYYVRSFFLVLISIIRCLSVTAPLWVRHHWPRWLTPVSCLATWLLAGVITSPFLFATGSELSFLELNVGTCIGKQYLTSWKTFSVPILGFFVPLILIIVCNLVICIRMRGNTSIQTTHLYRIISITTLVFLFCGCPFNTFSFIYFIDSMTGKYVTETLATAASFSSLLLLLNTCLNPFIYICTRRKLREIVKESLCDAFQRAFGEEQPQDLEPGETPNTSECLVAPAA